jgi:hypothetical protein
MRHAFRLPSEEKLTEAERGWIRSVAERVVRRRMGLPAALLTESLAPVQYLGAQALVFLGPVLKTVVPAGRYDQFVSLLARPAALTELREAIEDLCAERDGREGDRQR